jgi:hypothetical protein
MPRPRCVRPGPPWAVFNHDVSPSFGSLAGCFRVHVVHAVPSAKSRWVSCHDNHQGKRRKYWSLLNHWTLRGWANNSAHRWRPLRGARTARLRGAAIWCSAVQARCQPCPFGGRALAIPSKREETGHTQHHTADQGWESQREQLNAHVAILGRAHVGEGSEVPESRQPQDCQ